MDEQMVFLLSAWVPSPTQQHISRLPLHQITLPPMFRRIERGELFVLEYGIVHMTILMRNTLATIYTVSKEKKLTAGYYKLMSASGTLTALYCPTYEDVPVANENMCTVPLSLHTQTSCSSGRNATPYISALSVPRLNSRTSFPE